MKVAMLAAVAAAFGHKHPVESTNPFLKANAKKVRGPRVEDTGRWCFFENDNDNWCFATTPPFINVGWENLQEF
jgi:hypothetical protein